MVSILPLAPPVPLSMCLLPPLDVSQLLLPLQLLLLPCIDVSTSSAAVPSASCTVLTATN